MSFRRREFVAGAVGTAIVACAARAQTIGPKRRVGVLLLFAADDPEAQTRVRVLGDELRTLGWIEGRNLELICRFAAGDLKRMSEFAREVADLGADIIITNSMSSIFGVRQDLRAIPIVFAMIPNPVDQGLLKSLSDPGGTMTGFTAFDFPSIIGKWLELLSAAAPRIKRVAIMYDPDAYMTYMGRPPGSYWLSGLVEVARALSIEPSAMPVHDRAEIEQAMAAFAPGAPGGIVVATDTFIVSNYRDIVASARRHRLPGCYPYHYFADAGGLMSYGPNGAAVFRQVASYVDRILRGAKPADLPVQRPNKFDLVINRTTAKALDLEISRILLARADEVIE